MPLTAEAFQCSKQSHVAHKLKKTMFGNINQEMACLATILALSPYDDSMDDAARRQAYFKAADHLVGVPEGLVKLMVSNKDGATASELYSKAYFSFLNHRDAETIEYVNSIKRFPNSPENIVVAAEVIELGIQHRSGLEFIKSSASLLTRVCASTQIAASHKNIDSDSLSLDQLDQAKPFTKRVEDSYLRLLQNAESAEPRKKQNIYLENSPQHSG